MPGAIDAIISRSYVVLSMPQSYRAIDATNPFPQARLLAALPAEAVAEHIPRPDPEGAAGL